MMNREQLVRMLVLNEISDDYEALEQIEAAVTAMGRSAGLAISSSEIAAALKALIQDGLARPYLLSTTAPAREIVGVPADDELDEFYYWVTPKGLERRMSDDRAWPFNEDGTLREALMDDNTSR
jgi:hypothetical protein